MKDIKFIVTDLDDTLLRRDKTVSAYTIDVLHHAQECGFLLAFATARDFRFVTEHISPMTGIIPDVLIADVGALAFCFGKEVYKKMIPADTVNMLISQFGSIRCISTQESYSISGEHSSNHWSLDKQATIMTDFNESVQCDALYLDGFTDKSSQFYSEHCPEIRVVRYTGGDLVTLVHHEASKLHALHAVLDTLSMEMGDIVYFGDDYSDIEILSSCDNGIAVANAIDECKAAASDLCGDCDEDGVAVWIEENLL